jgi:very-short-patch-repair endonuclease
MRIKGDKRHARRLRRTMSLPEMLLWRELRKKPSGMQYLRQHTAGPYVLDFFCATTNVAIEVDGEAHSRGDQPLKDERRDDWLKKQGIRVMRIAAQDVLANLDGVLQLIESTFDVR